jgi:hypothetical protein
MLDPRQQRSERASELDFDLATIGGDHGDALHTGNTFLETVMAC